MKDFEISIFNVNVVFVLWDQLCRIISLKINFNFKALQMKVENYFGIFKINVVFGRFQDYNFNLRTDVLKYEN